MNANRDNRQECSAAAQIFRPGRFRFRATGLLAGRAPQPPGLIRRVR